MRKETLSGKLILPVTNGVIGLLRGFFWIKEKTTTDPIKREKLRQGLAQIAQMEREKQAALQMAKDPKIDSLTMMKRAREIEQTYAPENVADTDNLIRKVEAIRQESAQLKAIREAVGDDTERLIAEFRVYLNEHPTSRFGKLALAGALHKVELWDESIALYRAAARQEEVGTPGRYSSLVNAASVLADKGAYEEALAELKVALSEGKPEVFMTVLGDAVEIEIYASQGDREKARLVLKQARRKTKDKGLQEALQKIAERFDL